MSDFYKKVATPETQQRRTQASTSPSRDLQAETDARSHQGGFAGAVLGLLGATSTVLQTQNKLSTEARNAQIKKNGYLVEEKVKGTAEAYARGVSELKSTKEEGYLLTSDDIAGIKQGVKEEIGEKNGHSGLEYAELVAERMDQTLNILEEKGKQQQLKEQNARDIKSLSSSVKATVKFNDPNIGISELNDLVDDVYETKGDQLGMSKQQLKEAVLPQLVQAAIQSGDIQTIKNLRSDAYKDYFDSPDYENMLSMAETQGASIINQKRQAYTEQLQQTAASASTSGALTKHKDVPTFLKEAIEAMNIPKGLEPTEKTLLKMAKDLGGGVTITNNVAALTSELAKGNRIALTTLGLSGKEAEETNSAYALKEIGLPDLTSTTIEGAMSDPEMSQTLKAAHTKLPKRVKEIEDFYKSSPTDAQGLYRQANSLTFFKDILSDTNYSVNDYVTPKRRAFFEHVERLQELDVDKQTFQDNMQAYDDDIQKNTNSRGLYQSVDTLKRLESDEVVDARADMTEDVPWSLDDYTNTEYRKEAWENIFSIFANGNNDSDERIIEKTNKAFLNDNVPFEQFNGDRGTLPREWKDIPEYKVKAVLLNHPAFAETKRTEAYFGLDFTYQNGLTLEPARDYHSTRKMALKYDGNKLKSISRKEFDAFYDSLDEGFRKEQEAAFLEEQRQKTIPKNLSGFR
jgi:hypothetical protein